MSDAHETETEENGKQQPSEMVLTGMLAVKLAESAERLCDLLVNGEVPMAPEIAVQVADRMLTCANAAVGYEHLLRRVEQHGVEPWPVSV